MCQHCCRMEWTPCAPIPYACPLCPVRQVSDLCDGLDRGDYRRRYPYPKRNRKTVKRADNQVCRGISELYTHVVASKRNAKITKRRGRNQQAGTEIKLLPRKAQQQQAVKFRLDQTQYIDNNIPVLYREHSTDPNTWTWASRYSNSDKVLPVHARMDDALSTQVPAPLISPCRYFSSPYD